MIKYKYILMLLLVCLAFAKPIIAQSQESIFQLASFPAISGSEKPLLEEIKKNLPSWVETRFDNLDNLIVTLGKGTYNRLIVIPIDEPGYVVSEIRDDGYLRMHYVQTILPTGLFHQFHEGQPIIIHTEKGLINGVTAVLSTHLQRNRVERNNRICQTDDMWIDVGAKSRQEVLDSGIKLLDPISLRNRTIKLGEHQVVSPSAGLRASASALISLLQNLSPEKVDGSLTVAFVTQETFGRKGVDRLARAVIANETILVTDAWTATHLNSSPGQKLDPLGQVGAFGQGPIVSANDSYWPSNSKLQPVAEMQLRRAIYTQGPVLEGTKTHLVGLPTLFSSSTAEIVDSRDAQILTQLLLSKVSKEPITISNKNIAINFPPPSKPTLSPSTQVLKELVESYGVSGYEKAVRDKIKTLLPNWAKPTTDDRGNLVLTVGKGKPHLVFAAHMDEIGYSIDKINDDGSATIKKLGGFYDTLFEAHIMLAHTGNQQPLACVLSPRNNYFRAETRNPNTSELFIYFGTSSKAETEKLGVKAGTSITMPKEYLSLLGDRANGRAFDDRVGSAALILALQKLDINKLKHQVTFVWTVEEETGLDGAQDIAAKLKGEVDFVFAVDTFVSSDSPMEITRFGYAPIGKGAVVRALDNSNIVPRQLVNKVLTLANQKNIPIQYGVTGGGNDGAVFTQYGTVDIPISWPLRYSHSPAEVIDLKDLDALADLVKVISESW